MIIPIENIRVGQSLRIRSISTDNHELRCKLLAMGLTTGSIVTVVHKAPLGCPITLSVNRLNNTQISLRKSEAAALQLTTSSQAYTTSTEAETHDPYTQPERQIANS